MPAGYTHYCFGKDVYKHLDDKILKIYYLEMKIVF